MRRSTRLVTLSGAAAGLLALWGLGARGDSLAWPHAGPMPDDPVRIKPLRYAPIGEGNRSYRPVEPMPWGDVNRRVAPPGSLPGAPAPKKNGAGSGSGSGAAPAAKPKT